MFAPEGFISVSEMHHHFIKAMIRHPNFSEVSEDGRASPRHDFETRYYWFYDLITNKRRPIYVFLDKSTIVRVSPDILARGLIRGVRKPYFLSDTWEVVGFRYKTMMTAELYWLGIRSTVFPIPKYLRDYSAAKYRFSNIAIPARSIKPLKGGLLVVDAGALGEIDGFVEDLAKLPGDTSVSQRGSIGRPGKVSACQELYAHIFPGGHSGYTWKQVAEALSKEGDETFSVDTVKRAIGQRN